MPTNTDHLQAFSDLEGLWEVIGIGKVRQSTQMTKETEIQVFLAKPDPRSMRFSSHTEIRSRYVGCGHLGLVIVGSRWHGGFFGGVRTGDALHEGFIWSMGQKTLGATVEGNGWYHPTAPVSDAPVYQIRIGDFKEKKFAIVPVMELLRFTFGVTSGFLRQMFDGLRDEEIAPDRPFWDRKNSRWKKGKFHLKTNRPVRTDEARLGAALLTDPRLLKCHDGVFANLSSNLEWRNGLSAYVDTSFPYAGETYCKFRGHWIRVEDEHAKDGVSWRMLVTEILDVDYKSRVREIVIEAPKKAPNPIAGELARSVRKGSAISTSLTIEHPPHKGSAPAQAWTRQSGLQLWMEVDRAGPGGDFAPATVAPQIVERPERMTGSTADAESRGNRQVKAVQIVHTPDDLEVDSQTKTYEAIVQAAACRGWTLTDSEGRPLPGVDTWLVPIHERKRSRLLAVSVHTEAGSALVLDAGSRPFRRRALAVVARHDFGPASEDDVEALRLFALRANGHLGGRPGARPGDLYFSAHERPPEAWLSPHVYAKLVSGWISSTLRSSPALL